MKDNRYVDIDVFYSYTYTTTSSGGITTKSEGIDSSTYSIRAKVYSFDSILIPKESYFLSIDTNLNYKYKMRYYVEK